MTFLIDIIVPLKYWRAASARSSSEAMVFFGWLFWGWEQRAQITREKVPVRISQT